MVYKEGKVQEWKAKQRVQNNIFVQQQKNLLKNEKALHAITTERVTARILQDLQGGDEDNGGRETPSKEILRNYLDSASPGRCHNNVPPLQSFGNSRDLLQH